MAVFPVTKAVYGQKRARQKRSKRTFFSLAVFTMPVFQKVGVFCAYSLNFRFSLLPSQEICGSLMMYDCIFHIT